MQHGSKNSDKTINTIKESHKNRKETSSDRFYFIKKLTRKALYKLSHRIIKRDFRIWLKKHPNLPTFAQHKQDLFALYFFQNSPKSSLFFVDIGANDGITFSNTLALEKANWGGGVNRSR